MKKSELKQLIREVIEEVSQVGKLNLPVDVLNIPPEIMDMTVAIIRKNNISPEKLNLVNLAQALGTSAKSAQTGREKAPYDIFKSFDMKKQNDFLKYLKWHIKNENATYE